MYRRAVFGSVGSFDTSVGPAADYDLYLRIARKYPVHHHDEVVVEYRRHGTNMTGDPGRMLKATVSVLRKQRKHVKGNPRYEQAYKAGMREGQEVYGVPLANEVRRHVRQREWKRALRGGLVLLRYHPRGLALLNERRSLAVRLRARQEELRLHERQLRTLEERPGNREGRRVEELEGTLAKGRQEVQLIRRRTQRIALRIQKLDRQRARNRLVPGARKLLKRRMSGVRKLLRRRVSRTRKLLKRQMPGVRKAMKRLGRARAKLLGR